MNFIERLKSGVSETVAAKREEELATRPAGCESQWVGEPKQRIEIGLTLHHVLGPFPGDYGDRYGYVFHEEGTCNVMIWWSGAKGPGIDEGDTDRFHATVVKHTEYDGTKQTQINRVKPFNPDVEEAKKRRDSNGDTDE